MVASWLQLYQLYTSKSHLTYLSNLKKTVYEFYHSHSYFSVKNGVFRQYRGTRDKDEFISFVEEKKWEQVEPIPSWKSPSSIQMSVVSGFFKLSMMLRNIHTQITEEHGIPYWGSYLLFALATIIVGAVLGLVLVFLIDCFYPAKVAVKRVESKFSKSEQNVSLVKHSALLLKELQVKFLFL